MIHTSDGKHIESPPERIVISAMWIRDGQEHIYQPKNIKTGFVVLGYRHHNILHTNWILRGEDAEKFQDIEFGFLTNRDRFLNCEEAMELAKTYLDYLDPERKALYSEDLW